MRDEQRCRRNKKVPASMGTDWGLVYKPVARSKPDGTPSQCCNSRSPTTGSQITVFRNEIAINEIAINETPARVTCRPGLIVSRPSSDQTSARSRRKPAENAWRVPTGRPFNYPILGLLPNSLAKLNRGSTKVIFQYDDLHSANDPELRFLISDIIRFNLMFSKQSLIR